MQPVQIVTILQTLPLFKGETPADKIELIRFEENGFEVVAGKGLYEEGDKAVYVQPDFCLPDIPLFESFLRPNGDESKSMLGKVGGLPRRIRAKKFNFSILPNSSPVYSNGILLPKREVNDYLDSIKWPLGVVVDSTALQITKYEEPDETTKGGLKSGQTAGKWPDGLYKTDEDNINNVWGKLNFPVRLVGTEKCDGCLPYFQKVNLFDGTSKPISKLNIGDVVQGYCHETNAIVPSRVLNKINSGKTNAWYSINVKSELNNLGRTKTKLFCTGNHEIFANNKYTPASELNIGDTVLKTVEDYKISKDVENILIGKLLGDGSIDIHNGTKWAITFGHCEEQKDYLLYLRELLDDFVTDSVDTRISGYGSTMFRSRTKHSSDLNNLFSKWLETGTRQIPENLHLTPLSLCFWYLDDGSLNHSSLQQDRAVFSICSFNEESIKNLDIALKNYGFKNYTFYKCKKGYNYLRLQYSDTELLMESIASLVPKSMQYKLSEKYRGRFVQPVIEPCLKHKFNVEGFITGIDIIPSDGFIYGTKTKWDIETETSNFFAGEILIHNSSITIGINDHFPDGFICSRNLRKKLKINKVVGRRKKTFLEILKFWSKPDLNIYEEMENDDDFVRYGKPLLDKMKAAGLMNVIIRGELNGGSCKGSGNKNNPASKEPTNIKLFGVDIFENGAAQRVNPQIFFDFCEMHGFQHVGLVFDKTFVSKEELQETCENYFKTNLIEGIVVRSNDGFSAKYMNNEYDSKK